MTWQASQQARLRMAELLKVEGLRSGYGEAVVVQGISLILEQGQIGRAHV